MQPSQIEGGVAVVTSEARRAGFLPALASGVTIVVGATALLARVVPIDELQRLWRELGRISAPTAAAFLLTGVVLILAVHRERRWQRRAQRAGALAVVSVGALLFLVAITGARRLGAPPSVGGNLLLLGCALLLVGSHEWVRLGQFVTLAAAINALVILTGYAYGQTRTSTSPFAPMFMGQIEALLFVLLAVGILGATADHGLVAALRRTGPGGVMLRRMLLVALFLPLITGFLAVFWCTHTHRQEATRITLALLVVTATLAQVLLLFWTAGALDRMERVRSSFAATQELLAAIVQSSDDAIFTGDYDGRVTSWNPGAERIFGYPPEDVIGQPFARLVPPGELPLVWSRIERLRRGERVERYEGIRTRRDGSTFHASVQLVGLKDTAGRPIGISIVIADVTAQKVDELLRAELLARERLARRSAEAEQARLAEVLRQLPEGVVLTDATGKALTYNQRVLDLSGGGTGRTDRFGNPIILDLRRPTGEPVPEDELPLVRAVHAGVGTEAAEFVARSPDGRHVPLLVSARPIYDGQGQVLGAVAVYKDVSALKELERLRAEWTSVVAHDLRQPISLIAVLTEMLQRHHGAALPAEGNKFLTDILAATWRLAKMIEDLLDVSRIDARRLKLAPRPYDVGTIVAEVTERWACLIDGHRVRTEVQPGLPQVQLDPMRIEQVVGNLLSNAAKYGEPGTEIKVRVVGGPGEIRVSVTNRGPGIPREEQPRLFERFYRSSAAAEGPVGGVGLGLYISRGLVEAHGGRIWVESTPGETTTFTFSLPADITARSPTDAAPRRPVSRTP